MALMVSLSLPLHLGFFTVRGKVLILLYLWWQLCRGWMYLCISLSLVFQTMLPRQRSERLPSYLTTKEKVLHKLLDYRILSLQLFALHFVIQAPDPWLFSRAWNTVSLPGPILSLQSFNYHFRSIITQARERAGERDRLSRSVSSPICFPLEVQKRNAVVL